MKWSTVKNKDSSVESNPPAETIQILQSFNTPRINNKMNELKHFLNKEFGRNQGLKVPSSEKKNIKANNKPGFQNYRM